MTDYDIHSNLIMTGNNGSSNLARCSWEVTTDIDKLSTSWRIEFAEPIEVDSNAKFSIRRGIASPGYLGLQGLTAACASDLISDGVPEVWSIVIGSDSMAWGAEGRFEQQQDPKAAPQKDLYFVNPTWIASLAGGAMNWVLDSGVLYWRAHGQNRLSKAWQIEHADLPGKDKDPSTYQILFNYQTHWDIGNYLAYQMGCKLKCNTPLVRLRSVLSFSSTMSYFEAFKSLFSIWNPTIKIEFDKSTNTPTIYVIDSAGPELTKTQPRTIYVDQKAIRSISWKDSGKEKDPVDHVIVKGAKGLSRGFIFDPGQLTVTHMDPIELDPNRMTTFWFTDSGAHASGYKSFGDYTGGFNSPTAPPRRRPSFIFKSECYYVDPLDESNLLLVVEKDESYDAEGMLHGHRLQHTYGPGYQILYTIETEWGMIQKPGVPYKEYDVIRHKITDQSYVIDGLNHSNVMEIIEEPVVVTELTDPLTGLTYFSAPVSISKGQEQGRISKNPAAKQKLIYMTTKMRTVKINRVTRGVLCQTTKEYDCISETSKTHSQIIKDPRKNPNPPKDQYQAEFYLSGQSVFHKSVTVEHPDINDYETAYAVAERILKKSAASKSKVEVSLSLNVPINLPEGDFVIDLPAYTMRADKGGGVQTSKTLPGGKYLITQVSERASTALNGEIDHEQVLTLRNVL